MSAINFGEVFQKLTGNRPFPWLRDLYENWFSQPRFPDSCAIPTGLGKTSVMAVWLIALADTLRGVPRRLVYVVNRRTVVDQTTTEAEKMRCNANTAGVPQPAISTLRGQFADNREWSADPSKPAIIVGTVDMIGSRLLFSGYGIGFKSRPLHAGFLGQDALLVHDEAHLEPAFQELIGKIHREQHERERAENVPWPKLRVMELTATSRGGGATVLTLSDDDRADAEVRKRLSATKVLQIHVSMDDKKLPDAIAAIALRHKESARAILVFTHKVDDAEKIIATLRKEKQVVQQITGTLRGFERDRMADPRNASACPIFARFLREPRSDASPDDRWKIKPHTGTVYLVCTSAGEVGVNLSADHLVCDLTTFDSMAQRLGRVNRFGERDDTCIDVVCPHEFDETNDLDVRRKKTLELLRNLNGDGSPAALDKLDPDARRAAFAPVPKILPTSDILLDAWALTTIRGEWPGRPPVEPYLHGIENDKRPATHVAWRSEVDHFGAAMVTEQQLADLFDQFPLRPHELLRDATWRIRKELGILGEHHPDKPVWVIEPGDTVRMLTLGELMRKDGKQANLENLSGCIVVLPPSTGGLTRTGTLRGDEPHDTEREYDVAGRVPGPTGTPLVRLLVSRNQGDRTYKPIAAVLGLPSDFGFLLTGKREHDRLRDVWPTPFPPMRAAFRLRLDEADDGDRVLEFLVAKPEPRPHQSKHAPAWPALDGHRQGTRSFAREICTRLGLPPDLTRAVEVAAEWHDLGKGRRVWQLGAGNRPNCKPVSKPVHGRPPENLNHFRHELGSVVDVCGDQALAAELGAQETWAQELTQHLIAAQHGRARPHFPADEASDPERLAVASASVAAATPGRFARLQRRFGRWGLAYLESLVRAADALDSKRIEDTPLGDEEAGQWPMAAPGFAWPAKRPTPEPTIRVAVDPTNPGQFFACCGLLELADRLWPEAEGWFSDGTFLIAAPRAVGSLNALLKAAKEIRLAEGNSVPIGEEANEHIEEESEEEDDKLEPLEIVSPFQLRLDWWQDKSLKTWAGSMKARLIFAAMCSAIDPDHTDPLNQEQVVYDLMAPSLVEAGKRAKQPKKREPFYLDARRGANAVALDIGFMPDALKTTKMVAKAFPAVEALCFLGLQRCRPMPTDVPRVMDYCTWAVPLPANVAPAAVAGFISGTVRYRFKNIFRTGQKKHKAFTLATPIGGPQ